MKTIYIHRLDQYAIGDMIKVDGEACIITRRSDTHPRWYETRKATWLERRSTLQMVALTAALFATIFALQWWLP